MISVSPANCVPYIWPVFQTYLQDLWGEELDVLHEEALAGRAQLWVIGSLPDVDAVFTTQVVVKAYGKVLVLVYIAGRCGRKGLMEMDRALNIMKAHSQADYIEAHTDRKISRVLKRMGATEIGNGWWRR